MSPSVQVSPPILCLFSSYKALNPRPPLPWWSSKDSLLIEQRCCSNICALSAWETSSPFSNELQTAGHYTFSVLCGRLHTVGQSTPFLIWVYFPGDKGSGFAVRIAQAVFCFFFKHPNPHNCVSQMLSDFFRWLSDCALVAAIPSVNILWISLSFTRWDADSFKGKCVTSYCLSLREWHKMREQLTFSVCSCGFSYI